MSTLPIDTKLGEVVDALRRQRSVVLVAPPGSGKTTRVAPALLRSGLLTSENPGIVLLQPRRVAARGAAGRIAEENGWRLGEEVGYQIRFERRVGPNTRIVVETEGVLNRQLIADPFLEGVGAVILDEFHERSVHTDLAIALLKEVRETVRDDLLIVVMSATLDAEPVARFLGDCPIVRAEGTVFPVEIVYRPEARPGSAEAIASAVEEALESGQDVGHILVFLPGAEEIRRAAARLAPIARQRDFDIWPLHGSMPEDEQNRALKPTDRRKVILATNIAETSLTIDGVRTVIDSGLARVASMDQARGLDRLDLERISRASATQRAGRAGRTAPGRCVRLWSEREQRGMAEAETPEIARVDLASTLLTIHAWGVADPSKFAWFESPPPDRIDAAERLLVMLGAVGDTNRSLTPTGRKLLTIPAHPRIARLLLAAAEDGYPREGATLAALLSEKDIVATGRSQVTKRASSDLLERLDLFNEAEGDRFSARLRDRGIDPIAARRVARAREDYLRIARGLNDQQANGEPVDELLNVWVLLAYPDRIVRRRGHEATGVMVGGRGVRLAAESVVRDAEFFLAIDPRQGQRGAVAVTEARVRIACAIDRDWLERIFPESVRTERSVQFDEERQKAVGVVSVWYRDLLIREDRNVRIEPGEASAALAESLREKASAFVAGDEAAQEWMARLNFVRREMPERDWPELDEEALREVVSLACLGKRSVEEVRKTSFAPLLTSRLTFEQNRAMEELAPEALQVPTGNRIRLTYAGEGPPVLAVRLQELFGWTETPRIAGGRVAVVLHLLGPNFRAVQVTGDLRSFWASAYFQVRKDLRARYPRHSWPEDPLSAKAEAKGGRRH